jgi:two-component system, NtrC family, sensor histidine kinase HydH
MRHTLVPILLLCVALATVGVGVLAVIQRSRAELVEQFAHDRQAQLDEATRGVIEALEDVSEDLLFAGELLAQPGTAEEHRRELRIGGHWSV